MTGASNMSAQAPLQRWQTLDIRPGDQVVIRLSGLTIPRWMACGRTQQRAELQVPDAKTITTSVAGAPRRRAPVSFMPGQCSLAVNGAWRYRVLAPAPGISYCA